MAQDKTGRIRDPRPGAAMERVRAELQRRALLLAAQQRAKGVPPATPQQPFMPLGQDVTQQLIQRLGLSQPFDQSSYGALSRMATNPLARLGMGSQVAAPQQPFYPTPTGEPPEEMFPPAEENQPPLNPAAMRVAARVAGQGMRPPRQLVQEMPPMSPFFGEPIEGMEPEEPTLPAVQGAAGYPEEMNPSVEMTSPADAMAQREQPGMWGQLGGAIISGLTSSIVPAIVAFAGDRRNSPEYVRAWSESNALKIQEADMLMKQKIAEMGMAGDLLNAQRAWEQLELSKLQARVSILGNAREAMKDYGNNQIDLDTTVKTVQGLGAAYVGAGGNAEEFSANNPIPNLAVLRNLRKQADEASTRHAADPTAATAPMIPNPWAPGEFLSPQEVYGMLGEVDTDSGRVLIPLGTIRPSDIVERESRDISGVTRRFRSRIGEALNEEDIINPSLSEGVVTYPGMDPRGNLIINMLRRQPGQVKLEGQVPVSMSPIDEITGDIGRQIRDRNRVSRYLSEQGLTPEDITEFMSTLTPDQIREYAAEAQR